MTGRLLPPFPPTLFPCRLTGDAAEAVAVTATNSEGGEAPGKAFPLIPVVNSEVDVVVAVPVSEVFPYQLYFSSNFWVKFANCWYVPLRLIIG